MSQANRILNHLKKYGKITVPQLMRMGVAKYTNRIFDLRCAGWDIVNRCVWDKRKKCVKSTYFLV